VKSAVFGFMRKLNGVDHASYTAGQELTPSTGKSRPGDDQNLPSVLLTESNDYMKKTRGSLTRAPTSGQ